MDAEQLPSVDEFIDALSIDEPACHHRCGREEKDRCDHTFSDRLQLISGPSPSSGNASVPREAEAAPGSWTCSLPKGHRGPHVACSGHGFSSCDEHAVLVWKDGKPGGKA